MKYLDGSELAGYIKERQAKAVRGLRQAWGVQPKLAVIVTKDDPVINKYVSLKQKYAEDILVDVEVYRTKQDMVPELLDEINKDKSIHGVIVQLPLNTPEESDKMMALLPADKDIDGLNPNSDFVSATATAINWLLNGYDIDLAGSNIVIIGAGKLVGSPLAQLWQESGLDPKVIDENTDGIKQKVLAADVIVSATGVPGVLCSNMVKSGAVVVDAGTSSESGKIVGDASNDLYERDDISITPKIGGVGPLTIASLFENLITACRGRKGDLPEEP